MTRSVSAAVRLLAGLLLAGLLPLSAPAQGPAGGGSPFDLGLPGGAGPAGGKVSVTAKVVGGPNRTGTLHVTAAVIDGYHIYSLTQKVGETGGPQKTRIESTGAGYKIAGPFVSQDKARIHREKDYWTDIDLEEHHGRVTWLAPIQYDEGVDPAKIKVTGKVIGQVCQESCEDFKLDFTADYEKPSATPGELAIGNAKLTVAVNKAAAAPGDTVALSFTIEPQPGWHAYELAAVPPNENEIGNKPTLIVVKAPIGYAIKGTEPGSPTVAGEGRLRHYEGPVTFSTLIEIPESAKPGETTILTGMIGFQVCRSQASCDKPSGVEFSVSLPIAGESKAGSTPATLTLDAYDNVAAEVLLHATPPLDLRMLATIIGSGLLGGLILNLMPCVLPVIGLKILSFVEQAHHDRRHVLGLNLWYSAGLMAVFMALATLSVALNKSWGEQFTSTGFNIALSALVFSMALSFLGVWEIPIPGFVGSGRTGDLAQREGPAGAFAKGILTTILATPCSGPFLGFVFGFTLNQPAYVVYIVFASIGLGMASPYLLIGAFPQTIRFLPRPGAWMETFKQAMGFVLLGTVVFLFTFIDKNYLVPTFALLVAIWVGCWWIGRVPLTAEFGRKFAGWATGIALAVILGGGAFAALRPAEPVIPWRKFSAAALEKAKAEGKTVMIDFTADWCLTCKTNLKFSVDTRKTLALVEKNNVVPLLADWTQPSDEIKATLNSLGSNSIPVLAIFPAASPERPIILRDLLSQTEVIAALEEAGPSGNSTIEKAQPLAATR